jgi:hypothetical protein
MANRSYLYATNAYDVPNDVFEATGMSEFAYQVHPLYELLISRETKIVDSYIWKQEDIGIIGDLEEGKKLVVDFLRVLNELDPDFQTPAFEKFISDTVAFFKTRNEKYAFLEGGEVYEMEEGELSEMCEAYYHDAKESGKEVTELINMDSHGKLTLAQLADSDFYDNFIEISTQSGEIETKEIDWEGFWSTLLYYNFEKKKS